MNYWICVVPKSQSYELVLCDMNQLLNYSTTYLRIREVIEKIFLIC